MFALQKIARTSPKLVSAVSQQQVRNEYIIATKPRVRVSFAEKLAHGAFMAVCLFATPIWVVLHIGEYKNKKSG